MLQRLLGRYSPDHVSLIMIIVMIIVMIIIMMANRVLEMIQCLIDIKDDDDDRHPPVRIVLKELGKEVVPPRAEW